MATAVELLRQGRRKEFWQKYCGFFDLSIQEFMDIQERLLVEQLHLLADCRLGKELCGGEVPLELDQFRRAVPVTTYRDYVSFLSDRNEDVLPVKPYCWMRTSGRSGEYGGKWVPCSREFFSKMSQMLVTTLTLASAREKGQITLEEGDTLLYTAAPPPYITGTTLRAAPEEFPFRIMPPADVAEEMGFQERVQEGFQLSIGMGISYFVGIASVLLRIGESMSNGSGKMGLSSRLLRPTSIYRLGKAFINSKLQGRAMVPKDLWSPKGIVASGMDVKVYRDRIEELWGCSPLEAYACTEFGSIAYQAWGGRGEGLTFVPDAAFWEFMPEGEYQAWRQDPGYRPKTVLLNEVEVGNYVLVGTSLAGGAFVRYCVGDLIKIIALRDEELGIDLPQMVMESRADDIMNIAGMVLLTERSLWEAIGLLDQPLMDWSACKEFDPTTSEPLVHMYVECENIEPVEFSEALHNALVESMPDYASFDQIIGSNPIRVTRLAPGTFQGYFEAKEAEGADIGNLKPPRMQPSESVVAQLLRISADLAKSG
jgi:hypothetical protein